MVLEPDVKNALIPIFLKNIILTSVFVGVIYSIVYLILKFLKLSIGQYRVYFIIFFVVVIFVPLSIRIITLKNTTYYFYKTHVVSEFKFFKIKKSSVPYKQIARITSNISFWDRLCNAGDITLHTAEDRVMDLTLKYINDPQKIESFIFQILNSK